MWVVSTNQHKGLEVERLEAIHQAQHRAPMCVTIQEAWLPDTPRCAKVIKYCQQRGWTVLGNSHGDTVTVCLGCEPQRVQQMGANGIAAQIHGIWVANFYVKPQDSVETELHAPHAGSQCAAG